MVKEAFIGNYDIREVLDRYGLTGRKLYIAGDPAPLEGVWIPFRDVIMYRNYFPWLQAIDHDTVLILNNCLKRTQLTCLEYNCIRHYCLNAGAILVFCPLPLVESISDFRAARSFIAPNPFAKDFDNDYSHIHVNFRITYHVQEITLPPEAHEKYEALKQNLIDECRDKAENGKPCTPGIIPRRLLRFAEKYKPKGFDRLDDFKPEMKLCVSDLKCDQYFYHELLRKKAESESLYDYIPS